MDISKYFKYFHDLDDDLQNLITSKIKNPICKDLDADIINYKIFREDIIKKYEEKGYDYDIDGMFYIYYQIENDLIRYFNDDVATMDLITEKNIEKMERILSIKIKLEKNKKNAIDSLMDSNDNLNVISRINILIGALTCEEREQFLKLFPCATI
jgi:hypothetical protein